MHTALNSILASLPSSTSVWPGHEYTAGNAKFASAVLPDDVGVQKLQKLVRENKRTEGKGTIGDEMGEGGWNLFMRVGEEKVGKAVGESEPVKVMGKLREVKNSM